MSAEPVQVEQDNPKNLLILASVVVVTLGLAVMVVGVNEFFKFAIQEEIQTKQLAVVDPRRVELTSTEKAHLTKYQWVDKSAGVVRIPVERAQELVLKDWAERAAQPASPAVEPAPAPGKKRN